MDKNDAEKQKSAAQKSAAEIRQERLAAQLRANLQRRKAQGRARRSVDDESTTGEEN